MRLVIKVGTQVISGKTGLSLPRIRRILAEIAELLKLGHEIILVSSGAVGSGMSKRPSLETHSKKKIWAAIGQPIMMQSYAKEAERLSLPVGQVLILRDDFTNRDSFASMVNIVESLIGSGVLPVLNENDVMKTEDLTLGDNDILSSMVAVALSADKLIILTNRDGLYDRDPSNSKAKLIENVSDVDFEIERLCFKEKSLLGSGGMLSKVRAAKHAVNSGVEVLVGNGLRKGVILSSVKKNFPGTRFFAPAKSPISEAKRWMMSAKGVGEVIIDDGAIDALGSGKSLLLPGIISLKGDFDRSEIIEIISKSGQAVAYGKVNYSAGEIQRALALKRQSGEKGRRLLEREVVHRDYMVLLRNS